MIELSRQAQTFSSADGFVRVYSRAPAFHVYKLMSWLILRSLEPRRRLNRAALALPRRGGVLPECRQHVTVPVEVKPVLVEDRQHKACSVEGLESVCLSCR